MVSRDGALCQRSPTFAIERERNGPFPASRRSVVASAMGRIADRQLSGKRIAIADVGWRCGLPESGGSSPGTFTTQRKQAFSKTDLTA